MSSLAVTWTAFVLPEPDVCEIGRKGEDQFIHAVLSAEIVTDAVDPLIAAAEEGLAVVLTHHLRKGGGQHGAAFRGSTAPTGAADILVELERRGGERQRLLRTTSRFEDERKIVLELD